MQELFQKNTTAQVAIILATLALLWTGPLASPEPMAPPSGHAPLYSLLYALHIPPFLATLSAMLLTLLGGFLLNLVLVDAKMVAQRTLLPTLLYLVFMSSASHTLTPLLLVSLLSIALIRMLLLHSSLLTISSDKICGANAIIAVCSMLYLPSLALLATYLLVAVNYRLYGWRDWAVALLGLLAPYLLLWAVLTLKGGLMANLAATADGFGDLTLTLGPFSTLQALANIVLIAAAIIAIAMTLNKLSENTVVWQKNATTLLLPIISGLVMLLYAQLFPANMQLFALPLAFCGTHALLLGSKTLYRRRNDWRPWARSSALAATIIAAYLC